MTPRNRIARLHPDGSVDSTLNPNANGDVLGLALQADGKLVLGGAFTMVGVTTRNRIARLSQPEAALQSLTLDGNTVTWLRSGASPELALPPGLWFSLDGTTYAALGTMSRFSGGWRYSGLTMPAVGEIFYLRARGKLSSGGGNGSQGLIESTRQFFSVANIVISDVARAEGNAGSTAFDFTVSLQGGVLAPADGIGFIVDTADGTTDPANAGTDYSAIVGAAGTIAAGTNSTTVTVQVTGDVAIEANETFFVNLSSATGTTATLSDAQGLGTITDDDAAVVDAIFADSFE